MATITVSGALRVFSALAAIMAGIKRSRAAVDDANEASPAPWQLLPLLWVRFDPQLSSCLMTL